MDKIVVLWDYDGTLVNSAPKNIHITQQIIAKVAPRLSGDNLPEYLKSDEAYHLANHQALNWQDLYVNFYGMTEEEMLTAGPLWSIYQLKDQTPVQLFPGIKEVVREIDFPQGIISQNASDNIKEVLVSNYLLGKFKSIVGYDDIPSNSQKPHPFGGLKCLKHISGDFETVFYIGDHQGDVIFARNIQKELQNQSKVIAVTVNYSGATPGNWDNKPDFEVGSVDEILDLLKKFRS